MLHAEEELREVRALKEAGSSAVGSDGLIVLAFCGESVREADPSWGGMRVHETGFREEAACFGDAGGTEVVSGDGEVGVWFVWCVL